MNKFKIALVGALLFSGPAMAVDLLGTWQRADGLARIRMEPCGDAICGTIAWVKDPDKSPGKVGQRVFFDMKADGEAWKGSAFNPEDGKTYAGSASISGSSLTTKGCVLGGLFCKSFTWTRVN